MNAMDQNILQKLDDKDKQKIQYFVNLLLKQSKYKGLQEELAKRRKEIANGEVLTHSEIWNDIDV
ncbi:hypothetical protein JCM13304A_24900 [Desulfothermus okinawensis JCM 13304]